MEPDTNHDPHRPGDEANHGDGDNGHAGHHGHAKDRGFAAIRRYVKQTPRMWRSPLNDAVVAQVAPGPGQRVIDIGAGMGAGVMAAAGSGAGITAIEPTPFLRRVLVVRRMLSRARSRIVILDAAAEDLKVADSSVDGAWAVNAMHHWVDPTTAAAELARVLRPGGRVVLVDEDFADPAHPDAAKKAAKGHGPHRHGFHAVEADTMAANLAEAGLVDVESEKRTIAGRPALIVTAGARV